MTIERTVVLVKHSAPVLERDVAPRNWRLSEEGRRRSVVLADRLRRCEPGVFVSSDEPKAIETAEIAAGRLGVGCSVRAGLHEHDRTGAPFLGNEEFQQAARDLFANPDEPVWGNETAEQARARFEGAVRKVLDEREEQVVTIVAHGTVISLFVATYNDVDTYALWQSLGLPSFCVLTVPGFGMRESTYNLIPDYPTSSKCRTVGKGS